MKEEIILLGKKTYWWKIRVFLCTIIWLACGANGTWTEFIHRLIKHKCEWDINKTYNDQYSSWHPCKHHGCNAINVIDKGKY